MMEITRVQRSLESPEGLSQKEIQGGERSLGEKKYQKMQEAAQQFEAFFVGFIMETAQASVPKDGFFSGGQAEETYQAMFVQELAREGAQSRQGFGLADQIMRQFQSLKKD